MLGLRGQSILNRAANCMLRGELVDESVVVLGYAHPRGDGEFNFELALQRAETAAGFLVGLGVPRDRVRIASRGERNAAGYGPESWQLDRRVEIELDRGQAVGGGISSLP